VFSDDDPDILKGFGICLEADGFVNMHLAEHADETMRLVRAVRPKLLITDMLKPGLNGQDMARILKADPELSSMIVLLFSGIDERYPWDRSVFCGFIQKPCRIEPFIQVVRLLLGFDAVDAGSGAHHDYILN
jgi:DNA-binding NtrC family response regulator